MAHGQTPDQAMAKAQGRALRTLANRLEHAEDAPEFVNISYVVGQSGAKTLTTFFERIIVSQ